jgi:hypothetical protein
VGTIVYVLLRTIVYGSMRIEVDKKHKTIYLGKDC